MGLFNFTTKNKRKAKTNEQNVNERPRERKIDYSNSGSIERFSPKSFDDVAAIIDRLLYGEPVIVDVSEVSVRTAQRVIDLMSGAIYAIDGNMGEMAKDIYVFTPGNATK